MMTFWHAHAHSVFSSMDAISAVPDMVNAAQSMGQPALALTDHGTMGGAVDLYNLCRKADIVPFPGIEAYVLLDHTQRTKRVHLTMLAYNETGYRNLVGLTRVMARDFYHKPLLTLPALAQAYQDGRLHGIAVGTGCFFGVLPVLLRTNPEAIPNVMKTFMRWFDDQVYVELMHHGIYGAEHDDDELADVLVQVADTLCMPAIFTADSHYIHADQRPSHDLMKRINAWGSDPSDALFPGDAGYFMCDEQHIRTFAEPHVVDRGMVGLDLLLSRNTLRIPELEKFTLKVPHLPGVKDAKATLRRKCLNSERMGGMAQFTGAQERLDSELEVINNAGFAEYLLLTAKITDWLAENNIAFTARGSASGSLVCYALGITSVEPLRWGLRFDRFLSTDRTKPPDIDIDIQHDRRHEVFEMLEGRYSTLRIGSWMTMGLTDDEEENRGSLMVKWRKMLRNTNDDPDRDPSPDEQRSLRNLAAFGPTGGMGKHAAGIVIAENEHALSGVPVAWNATSKHMQTAVDGDRVEKLGLPKVDLLGSKTLTVLDLAARWSGTDWRTDPDMEDKEIYKRLSKGDVAGAFQADGYTARKGMERLKPKNLADIVISGALFRPAVMDSGHTDEYLERRRKRTRPKVDPILDPILKETYGIFLYQEQVLAALRAIGMDADQLTAILKAVKASNQNIGDAGTVMRNAHKEVEVLAAKAGMNKQGTAELLDALDGYSKYGFNKSHAVAYARLTATTLWYAVHHPTEFYAALLAVHTDKQKRYAYTQAARDHGVQVLPPDVNTSQVDYAPAGPGKIMKGLSSIDNVGPNAAAELSQNQPYATLDDIVDRCTPRIVTGLRDLAKGHPPSRCGPKTTIRALFDAGALTGMGRREE
jgi:DNA polymerase-3 subunit alpha